MGAASSCAIFECFSTMLEFVAKHHGGAFCCLHVLDDFLFIAPSYNRCSQDLSRFLEICASAGIPIAQDKTQGPAQVLEFLGITLNVPGQYMALPSEKVSTCQELLGAMRGQKKATLDQLQRLLEQ